MNILILRYLDCGYVKVITNKNNTVMALEKIYSAKMATAYGYDPDRGFSGLELSDVYVTEWTEYQAAQDIAERYQKEYGLEPLVIKVNTVTKWRN